MKLALVLSTTFLSSLSMAEPNVYKLDMKMAINGNTASALSVVAIEGERASVVQTSNGSKTFFNIIAKKNGDSLVLMEFSVGNVSQTGVRSVISTPRIIAPLNEPAEITVVNKDGSLVSIAVSASKI